MTKVIAISMNKGGVGKTSLVTNLAGSIGKKLNKKVLIVDTDGQGNTSLAFGLNPNEFEDTIFDVLLGNVTTKSTIINVGYNVDILPANDDMNMFDFEILTNTNEYKQPFHLLRTALQDIIADYDYILIDTPPSLSLVAGNVLVASDEVIIPFVPETFAVRGLIKVVEAIADFRGKYNSTLSIAGIVGMMVDNRTSLHSGMLQQARRFCLENDIHMFETIIPKSIRFANSTAYEGKPAVWTDANNTIVSAYFELMNEITNQPIIK